jgi:hypothetical protein
VVRVELRGNWRPVADERALRVLEVRREVTVVEIVCRDGITIEVILKEVKEAS